MGRENLKFQKSEPKPEILAPPWTELPRDVTANILHRLGAIEILESAQRVCTTWRSVCKDPSMWRVIDMWNLGDLFDMPYDLKIICRHAVDRSQGQLVDINVEYFGNDKLLGYISERSSQLRRLRLALCYNISGICLTKAAMKFPLLEELHLFFMKSVSARNIEAVGRLCPLLKSFTYNHEGFRYPIIRANGLALAVAKTMPGLLHLRLFGNKMTNKGLQAIVDGCPHLESLDLRQCFNLVLESDLGKRCSRQIKNLRRPLDSTLDYEWKSDVLDSGSCNDDDYLSDESDIYCFSESDYCSE